MLTRSSIGLFFSTATRRRFYLAVLGSVLAALADAAGVLLILPLIQLITGEPQDQGLLGVLSGVFGDPPQRELAIYLAGLTFGAFLLKGLLTITFRWWVLGFVVRQEAATSVRLLRHYLAAPYGLHVRRGSPDLLRTMQDAVGGAYSQVVVGTINIIAEALTVIAVSAALLVLMPLPALILLAYFAVAGLVFYHLVRPTANRAGEKLVSSSLRNYRAAMHALGGIKEIKIRHTAGYFLDNYSLGQQEYAESKRVAIFLGELPKYVFEIVFIVGIGLMTVYVFATSPSGEAVAALALVAAAGFRIMPGTVRLIGALHVVRLGRAAFDLVHADLVAAKRTEVVAPREPLGISHLDATEAITVEGVGFRYPDRSEAALTDVSLEIPVGAAVALVGASGAGKSTLVDVILGLQAPTSGRVCVDGRDIRGVLTAWQQSLGLVPQDVYLLDDTLRANIAFGQHPDDIDEDRLESSVSRAQLHELVAELPQGMETTVGERGMRLSGGQRQRIGIARALYSEPLLLILDEATSALDNETERRISRTIADLHGHATILIVAHRLSTVRNCDRIVFMKDGRVAATGTFESLQAESAEFATLVQLGSLQS
jgi:ATP-binding cassette, subfamily B, bacterial PglK